MYDGHLQFSLDYIRSDAQSCSFELNLQNDSLCLELAAKLVVGGEGEGGFIYYIAQRVVMLEEMCLQCFFESAGAASLHCVPKNAHIIIFLNNSVKNEPILIIFDTLNPKGT